MLSDCKVVAMLATTQPEKAKPFYREVLGLKLLEDGRYALYFEAGGTRIHIQKVQKFAPLPFTALGWSVPDARSAVAKLSEKGVKFERYQEMQQDELGIWTTPAGGKVGWFKDPDGNLLSLTQFPRE
jgi:catechol 2,3-dioxygenase-like lactoylglutathione lyase family enzyme